MNDARRIKLVVFDWAGTTVDHGCYAPVAPFVDALAQHGVTITMPAPSASNNTTNAFTSCLLSPMMG